MQEPLYPEDATQAEWLNVTSLKELEQTMGAAALLVEPREHSPADDSRYQMILQVGEGAMGQVFLARDADLLRKVAYKRLHQNLDISDEVLSRFIREIQITAQLEHPNVVPVYNLEKTTDGWAYAMKLVFGKTLKESIEAARQAYDTQAEVPEDCQLDTQLSYFLNVCEALEFAHQRGVIHRDLKPANIMIGRYREVYVMDWGIARVMGKRSASEAAAPDSPQPETQAATGPQVELLNPLAATDHLDSQGGFDATQMGKILGTPRYLSPEQAAGKNQQLDGRSDLLTLGLILQELVTLRPAYQAKKLPELLKKVLKTEREPLLPYHPKRPIARELKAIIAKACARRPDERYQRVSELAADLRRYLRGQAVIAQPDTPLQALLRWLGQHQLLTAGLVMGFLTLLALLTIGTFWQQKQSAAQQQRRQEVLSQLQTSTSQQAQLLNNRLLGYHRRLEALASQSAELWRHRLSQPASPSASAKTFYLQSNFATPGQQPPDFSYSPYYAKLLSLQEPVLVSAASMPPAALLPLKGALQNAYNPQQKSTSQLLQQGTDLVWLHLALPEQIYLSYPGKAGYHPDAQASNQHWYQDGISRQQVHWGLPHLDPQGQGMLISASLPIYFDQQKIGVVALDLSFQYLVDHLMHSPLPQVREKYLFTPQGEIVLRASERSRMYGMRFGQLKRQEVIDTPLFDQPEVVAAIRSGKSGYQRYLRNGRPMLLAYYRLNSLNWFYGVEMDGSGLFED